MTETMGQIIKRLRKEKNLTQEELAEQLCISSAAVSKWENNTSMPDISQVVPLANLFGVSTDVLFGMYGSNYDEEVKARLEEIFRIYDNCQDGDEAPTALVILDKYREAMRVYPNNSTIMVNAMAFAEEVLTYNSAELSELIGQNGINYIKEEIVRWAELVIRFSPSIDDVLAAKGRLIGIHVRSENWKEAFKLAETFPRDVCATRSIQMAKLKHDSGDIPGERSLRCRNICELASQLAHQTVMLGNLYRNEEKYSEALYCYSFFGDMVESIYRDEEYRPPFVYDQIALFRSPAVCMVKLGRNDEAIDLLEKGIRFVKKQAENYNKKKKLDVPLLADCSFGYGYDGGAEYSNVKSRLKNMICGDDLAPLAQNSRYQKLLETVDSID